MPCRVILKVVKLKLLSKKQETSDVTSFIFEYPTEITYQAGQFFHYVLHHRPTDDRGSDRFFTNAAAPFEKKVMITTRETKDKGSSFKKKLFSLVEGKSIEVSNVSGDFVLADMTKEYIFIAGGIGITPFRSMLVQFDHEGQMPKIALLYANKEAGNVVYKEELEMISKKYPQFTLQYVFSPEHIDEKKIKEVIPDFATKVFYISGPEPMVDALGEALKTMSLPEENLKQDWFPGYVEA